MTTVNKNTPIQVRTDNGWVIVLQPAPWSDEMELWIGRTDSQGGKFLAASVQEDGYLKLTEVKDGSEQGTPTLRINRLVWEGLAEALRGVIPQVDRKEVDAELKATKYHLEDMRTLVLKKKT